MTMRFLPVLTFVLVTAIGLGGAIGLYLAERRAAAMAFVAVADDAATRIEAQFARHLLLLNATAAFVEAGPTDPASFAAFADRLALPTRHPDLAALGYASLAIPDGAPRATSDGGLGAPGDVVAVPVDLLAVSGSASPEFLGEDLAYRPAWRAAMEAAARERQPRAAERLAVPALGDQARRTIAVFAPVADTLPGGRAGALEGFAFMLLRFDDVLAAALATTPFLQINLAVHDDDTAEAPLFSWGQAAQAFGGRTEWRSVDLAGRNWQLAIRPTAASDARPSFGMPALLAAASLLLAGALAGLLRAQARAHAASQLLAETMERNLTEKDLMLQEMKHRIKNSIARILAIARQTAARSETIEDFSETFTARLQAMAAAQDVLTRSRYGRADLRALLVQELAQVFGEAEQAALAGPDVALDEATTRALGLTFHELATNAMKYGGADGAPPAIAVTWSVRPERGREPRDGRTLVLDWRETGGTGIAPPSRTGFGTRLIDANIRGELGGTASRRFEPDGFAIRIEIPLGPRTSAAGPRPAPAAAPPAGEPRPAG